MVKKDQTSIVSTLTAMVAEGVTKKHYDGPYVKPVNEVGAAWKHTDKNGVGYIAAQINILGVNTPVMLFANQYKTRPNHPDYTVIYPTSTVKATGV